jgi:hypothetical protein
VGMEASLFAPIFGSSENVGYAPARSDDVGDISFYFCLGRSPRLQRTINHQLQRL